MTITRITGIMASDPQGVIGNDSGMLWNYPNEIQYFKQITKHEIIVMGRKTFVATPPSLFVDRTSIVFSKNHPLKNSIEHRVVSSLEDFISLIPSLVNQKIFMIGGAELAHLFLEKNLITEFLLTKIHKSYLGNIHLNLNLFKNWSEEIIDSTPNYTITKLKNPIVAY